MKTMFTVHAGEFLVGSHIQNKFPHVNIWVPAKDTGIDLLVSDASNGRTVSLQVKFSTDYRLAPTQRKLGEFHKNLKACGWWKFNDSKMTKPHADYWVLVLKGYDNTTEDYIVIQPQELEQRMKDIHEIHEGTPIPETWQVYVWITMSGQCWETRDLNMDEMIQVAKDEFVSDPNRDFKQYLNAWEPIERLEKA